MKRIGIDARFWSLEGSGLGRFSQKLIEHLEVIHDNENCDFYIFLMKDGFDLYHPGKKNFHKILADYKWYSIKEQVFFVRLLYKYNLDITHFCHFNVPFFYRKKFIVTIHDLIFSYPNLVPIIIRSGIILGSLDRLKKKLYCFFYNIIINSACKRSIVITAVSEHTKKEIAHFFKVDPQKIAVHYEGYDLKTNSNTSNIGNIINQYRIKKPYLLYVGNAYPHKNLENLCLAFSKMNKRYPSLSLILVGKKDLFYKRLERSIRTNGWKNIKILGFIPDQHLDAIYRGSSLFVFPSLYEGFGIPPLEALARRIPVAASNKTSVPEILGDAALYFDPYDNDEIIKIMEAGLNSEETREAIIKRSEKQLNKFDWTDTAVQINKIYMDCL